MFTAHCNILFTKKTVHSVHSLTILSDHMAAVTCCGAVLMEMSLSVSVYNGIFVSALSSATKIAAMGTVYACEVCRIKHD